MRTDLPAWAYERPATTVVGTFRPDVIAAPGYRKAGDGPRQNAEGSVKTSIQERAILQGFPAETIFVGAKTAVSLILGNAVPPPLAEACLKEVWTHD